MASTATIASSSGKAYNFSKFTHALIADDSIKWQQKVPVGIRFNPNDQVLAGHYLVGKVSGSTDGSIFPLIKEIDVYQHDPSELSRLAYDFGKGKMYFFTRLNKKHEVPVPVPVPSGYWKKTGEPSYVKDKDENPIATKKTLAYYKNDQKSNPVKTQWRMKEYILLDNELPKQYVVEYWTLCVVYYSKPQCESLKMNHDEENNFSSESDMSSSDSE